MSPDENSGAQRAVPGPDPHGQAALLLAESTLHMLVERSVISVPEAIAVVQTAAEVKAEVAIEAGEAPELMQESIELLFRISDSLGVDVLRA